MDCWARRTAALRRQSRSATIRTRRSKPHFAPRANSVISLFMSGGVSHLDTFDPKPALAQYAGQPLSTARARSWCGQGNPGSAHAQPVSVPQARPVRDGRLGDLPDTSRSMWTRWRSCDRCYGKSNDHVQATYELNTGKIQMGLPSVGSWVTYGLGSENQSLPAFVVIYDHRGGPLGGPANWSAGYMPAAYQATDLPLERRPDHRSEAAGRGEPEQQRDRLDLLAKLNELDLKNYPGSSELAARISSYELAYRMQGCAPEAVDVNSESEATRKLYGMDDKTTEPFARQCLDGAAAGGARSPVRAALSWRTRPAESGHVGCARRREGKSYAARRRSGPPDFRTADRFEGARFAGSTRWWCWHGEFGRMPISQKGVGRDHNPGTMTMWMAGARIKGGQIIGASDELRLQGGAAADRGA